MRLSFQAEPELNTQLYTDLSKISPAPSREDWQGWAQQGKLFSCRFNQRHVAYCIASAEQQVLKVEQLRVRELTQRRGIGLYLFQQLLEAAKAQGCNALSFPVPSESSGIAFYRQMGIEANQPFYL